MVTLTLLLLKIQEQFTANDLSVKYRKKSDKKFGGIPALTIFKDILSQFIQ